LGRKRAHCLPSPALASFPIPWAGSSVPTSRTGSQSTRPLTGCGTNRRSYLPPLQSQGRPAMGTAPLQLEDCRGRRSCREWSEGESSGLLLVPPHHGQALLPQGARGMTQATMRATRMTQGAPSHRRPDIVPAHKGLSELLEETLEQRRGAGEPSQVQERALPARASRWRPCLGSGSLLCC
jgi:hypothetical protein